MRRALLSLLLLIAVASLSACEPTTEETPSPSPTPRPAAWSTAAPVALSRDEIVERARSDLVSARLALFQDATVLAVDAVQLPSGSLGCPTFPWTAASSGVEWGYRILLGLGGQVYEYRASQEGRVVTCGQSRSLAEFRSVAPTPTPTAERFVEAARGSLSSELGLRLSEITLLDAQPGRWVDFSLGCPQIGKVYPLIEAQGYSIWLRAKGQIYELHANALTEQVEHCARGVVPTPTWTPRSIYEIIPVPTTAPSSPKILPATSLDRALSEIAAERGISIGEIRVESVEPAESSRWAEQCRGYAGVTAQQGSVAELSLPGGTSMAVYLGPDGSFVRCGQ